jgi:uncharacterized MAPEG superfamily protein
MLLPVSLDWPHVIVGALILTYVPHLLLRVPAVHLKLAADKKKAAVKGAPSGYDIRAPREAQAAAVDDSEEGRYISRLNGQHSNSHEAFPIICASIFTALYRGVSVPHINEVATIWLASRVVHTLLYVYGASKVVGGLRGIVWVFGLGCCSYLILAK